jgi:Tfp pilus assembly protein PilO
MRGSRLRERTVLIAAGAALAGFLLVFFVVLPMRDTAKNLSGQIRTFSAAIDEANKMYRQMPAAEEEAKQMRAETAKLFMPENVEVTPSLVREIAQLNSDLGINLNSIRPAEPEPVGNGVRYPVSFRIEADFPHIVRLLFELEQPPHRLWVEGIEITPGARGASGLSALVHVASYSLKSVSKGTDEEA